MVQKEKIDEAREALVTIAKWNGKNTAEHRKAIDDVLNQERERIRQVLLFNGRSLVFSVRVFSQLQAA